MAPRRASLAALVAALACCAARARPAAGRAVPVSISSSSRTQTVDVHLPPDHEDGAVEYPLVLLLHGRQDSRFVRDPSRAGAQFAGSFGIEAVAEGSGGLIWMAPNAHHQRGRAWCASPSCCCGPGRGEGGVHDLRGFPSARNFEGSTLRCGRNGRLPCRDDDALDADWLREAIEQVSRAFPVDRRRVYVVGLSNGAYMAWRLACRHSDLIAGIISVCGASVLGVEEVCRGASPVHVLHVHGTADPIVSYYPVPGSLAGARRDVGDWARSFNGCGNGTDGTSAYNRRPRDHDGWGALASGVEVERYVDCLGAEAELWTVPGGGHCPGAAYLNMNWLLDKSKPEGRT